MEARCRGWGDASEVQGRQLDWGMFVREEASVLLLLLLRGRRHIYFGRRYLPGDRALIF